MVLDFRDLMEIRVADAFIRAGISAIKVRAAIQIAREELGRDHPLSTDRFRTDGRKIFLHVIETDPDGQERERLLNMAFDVPESSVRRAVEFEGSLSQRMAA
ncbi:hypothetical protein SS05631_c35970 [Sinorhizobium sp. CCBAU 05631]|nr:hypothetical protein SS05631_c35970 [Sinorhizobium sp. CCBAU 05631]